MLEVFLAVVFAIHATAFAYFYVRRGRRLYSLVFFFGFMLLWFHYLVRAWHGIVKPDFDVEWVNYLRWVGIGFCAAATPIFLRHIAQRILGREAATKS